MLSRSRPGQASAMTPTSRTRPPTQSVLSSEGVRSPRSDTFSGIDYPLRRYDVTTKTPDRDQIVFIFDSHAALSLTPANPALIREGGLTPKAKYLANAAHLHPAVGTLLPMIGLPPKLLLSAVRFHHSARFNLLFH